MLNATAGQYDTIWCLGDIVGYARPNGCVELLRERATVTVMGNHDWPQSAAEVDVDNFNPHARQAASDDTPTPENHSGPAAGLARPAAEFAQLLITAS